MQKTTPNTRTRITLSASILFILLAVLYFLPVDLPFKIAYPLVILAILSPWILPWQMCLAMFFSAAGDAAGAYGSFILQTGFFALAQIMLIVFFISRAIREKLYSNLMSEVNGWYTDIEEAVRLMRGAADRVANSNEERNKYYATI